MRILLIILTLPFPIICIVLDSSETIFWLTSKLENIDWRKGCLTTAGCAQPRFQLVLLNGITNEKMSKSWLITPQLMQERQRSYVTHWSDGNPSDIQITCEVVGVDPTYGFPRICDSSTSIGIYQNEALNETEITYFGFKEEGPFPIKKSDDGILRDKKNIEQRSGTVSEVTAEKVVVELTARCFNSTITMEKHEERCPWCIEYSDDTVINQQYPEDLKAGSMQFIGSESYLNVLVLAFALTTALSSALCAFLLFLYLRQKKNTNLASRKCQSYGKSHINAAHVVHIESPNGSNSNESARYDTPWDRKYRPLPRWTSSRSSSSTASPPDTSSTVTGSSQHSKATKVIIGNTLHQVDSPDSSIYERPEDSGLGSV